MSATAARKGPLKKMAHVGPNMTPMVDVVMCILIFFMLASTFLAPELFLKSSMPAIDKQGLGTIATTDKLPPVRFTIKLRRQGDDTWVAAFDRPLLKMNQTDDTDQTMNKEILGLFVAKSADLSKDVQIIIQPDRMVPYQDVITVYDYCVKAKFQQVAFAPAG